MWKLLRCLLLVGCVYFVVQVIQIGTRTGSLQGRLELIAFNFMLGVILVAWLIWDSRTYAKPPTDGPEADYYDSPEPPA